MKRIVVGITGATGAPLAVRVLEFLHDLDVEVNLIVSQWARATLLQECGISAKDLKLYVHEMHDASNQAATISSGSFHTDGMIIVPCSMKTLAAIRCGYADNLIARAADVTIKERRRLVLVARESPLSPIHLENLLEFRALARPFFHRRRPSTIGRPPSTPCSITWRSVSSISLDSITPALYTHGLVVIVSTKMRVGGFGKALGMSVLTTPHGLGYAKVVIVVDDFVDPFNLPQVMWAISTKVNPKYDTVVIPELSVLALDPDSEPPGLTHKMIIDATTPAPPEKHGEYSMQVMDPPEAKDWLPKLQALLKKA